MNWRYEHPAGGMDGVMACIVFVTLFIAGIVVMACNGCTDNETVRLLQTEASAALKEMPDPITRSAVDKWGTTLLYRADSQSSEHKAVTVVSAGADKKFDTSDDVVIQKVDFNKSKIVGKWAGKRAKEAVQGWTEGLKSKSDFEK